MQKKILQGDKLKSHISKNRLSYIMLFLIFAGGVLAGSLGALKFNNEEFSEISGFFDGFKSVIIGNEINSREIFINTVISGFKELGIIWALGFMVIGVLPIGCLIFKKGFLIGICSALIIKIFGVKGFAISGLSFLFQSIIYIPLMFYISLCALNLSTDILRKAMARNGYYEDFKAILSRYALSFIFSAVIFVFYAVFESYLTVWLLKICF